MTTLLLIVVLILAGLLLTTRLIWRWAERRVPPAGKFCPVKGGVIHHVEAGEADKPVLVLIHGLAGMLQHFSYAMLEPLSRDYRVIALDRPGCGYSTRERDALAAPPLQARMIWDFLDRIGVKDPVLVGHSLGGAMALAMALERPGGARALALIAPASQSPENVPEVFRPFEIASPLVRRVIGHLLAVPMGWLTTNKVMQAVFEPEPWPRDFLIRGGAVLTYRPSAFIGASADLVEARRAVDDMTARYRDELKTPGAILFGQEDAILSPELHGTAMAEFGLTCEMVEGRGHMLPVTDPDACCDFVRRVAGPAA